jgi:hypothetical protein
MVIWGMRVLGRGLEAGEDDGFGYVLGFIMWELRT